MQTIDLAYVERGVHEELVAQVADQEGYSRMRVSTSPSATGLAGTRGRSLRRGASIGLGRALLQRMTGGIGWKVLSVNTHRPLFWFVGNADVASMAESSRAPRGGSPRRTAPVGSPASSYASTA